ncbi:hypothetical protein G6F59_013445 [Rhizopus arrhizus]|nr:hypothetical protein G6F59_013445 [Rhizopus arrhizus]
MVVVSQASWNQREKPGTGSWLIGPSSHEPHSGRFGLASRAPGSVEIAEERADDRQVTEQRNLVDAGHHVGADQAADDEARAVTQFNRGVGPAGGDRRDLHTSEGNRIAVVQVAGFRRDLQCDAVR